MDEKVTFKSFFSTIWRGVRQAFGWLLKVTGLKGYSKYTRALRTIVGTCLTIWIAAVTIALVYSAFERQIDGFIARNISDRGYYDDRELSPNVYLQQSWRTDFVRVYNYETDKVTLKSADWVAASDDSLAVYSKNGRRGYLNRFTGEIAIPARFDKAWVFSEGLAAVQKDGRLMFIDRKGNIVLDGGWHSMHDCDFLFKGGYCAVWSGHEHGVGVIDRTGAWHIEPEYDHITAIKGFWVTELGGRYGLLDAALNEILEPVYESISFKDDFIRLQPYLAPTMAFSYEGRLINDCLYYDVDVMHYESMRKCEFGVDGGGHECPVYAEASCYMYTVEISAYDYRYGLLDRNGIPVTEPIYTSIDPVAYDLYLCQPHGILIDGRGETVE